MGVVEYIEREGLYLDDGTGVNASGSQAPVEAGTSATSGDLVGEKGSSD